MPSTDFRSQAQAKPKSSPSQAQAKPKSSPSQAQDKEYQYAYNVHSRDIWPLRFAFGLVVEDVCCFQVMLLLYFYGNG